MPLILYDFGIILSDLAIILFCLAIILSDFKNRVAE